jgi:hypothetical protein
MRIANFGALTGFQLLYLSVGHQPHSIRPRSGDCLRHLLFPLTGLLVIAYVLFAMDKAANTICAWVACGAIYYLVLTFVL